MFRGGRRARNAKGVRFRTPRYVVGGGNKKGVGRGVGGWGGEVGRGIGGWGGEVWECDMPLGTS